MSACNLLMKMQGNDKITDVAKLIGSSQEIMLAVSMQNALHPKNGDRTAAINEKKYFEIRTQEEAVSYLSDLLRVNL